MGYKLNVVCRELNVNFNCRYENMARSKKPEIVAKNKEMKQVREHTVYQGTVLKQGDTNRMWCDEEGNTYDKSELTFWLEDEEVFENEQSKVFDINEFEPLSNYTDRYVIDKFYELTPSNNDTKSDYDRKIAIATNLSNMRRLWEYLSEEKIVGRAEFIVSSRGFVASDGYIRAVEFDDKWGLEIGVFKERKVFEFLQTQKSFETTSAPTQKKKVKMI